MSSLSKGLRLLFFAFSAAMQMAGGGYVAAAPQQHAERSSASSLSSLQVMEPISRDAAAQEFGSNLDQATDQLSHPTEFSVGGESGLISPKALVDAIESRMAFYEVMRFSPTTTLSGQSTFVLGSSFFNGSALDLVDSSRRDYSATTVNYDMKLMLDTSFNGRDLLHIRLRAGNFDSRRNSFAGAGPSALSQLEVAFQELSGVDRLSVNRLYYQFPVGDFVFTIGPRVEQDNMLAVWPNLYPSESILDLMTFAGAIGANNLSLGVGAGVWWKKSGFSISASYVASNGQLSESGQGGIGTSDSGSTSTVQIGYSTEQWAIAAIYSSVQNGQGLIPYATNFTLDSFSNPGNTSAFGLSGYWQPLQSGWIPSISVGWGLNKTSYASGVDTNGLVATSLSWALGLQWQDAFVPGNTLGMAVGQATFATSLYGGESPRDGNYVWEWWYRIQLTDNIAVTPALFYLYRPLGADTPSGESFNQLGALVKVGLSF